MFEKLEPFLKTGSFPPPPVSCQSKEALSFYGFTDGTQPEEPGAALLYAADDCLVTCGVLSDRDLYNDARRDNDTTWLLGDTFELLFQIRGHEDYYEFHSTPEGYRLQLHIQDYRTFRSVPHEEKICDAGLMVRNEIERDRNLWKSELRIPFCGIGLTPDLLKGSRFAIVRQNYTHGRKNPEITSTQVFPRTAHTPYLWHRFESGK